MRLTVETPFFTCHATFALSTVRRRRRIAHQPRRAPCPRSGLIGDRRRPATGDRPAATERPRRSPAVTSEQVQRAEALRAEGHTVVAIATLLGVNRSSLYNYLPSLGGTRGQHQPRARSAAA